MKDFIKRILPFFLIVCLISIPVVGCQKAKEVKEKKITKEKVTKEEEIVDKTTYAPYVVDKKNNTVSFKARVKKPEHPAGEDPKTFSHPNALVVEPTGGALLAAALVAEDGAVAEKLCNALESIGLKVGESLPKDAKDATAGGDPVEVTLKIGKKEVALEDLLKDGNPDGKTKYVYLGNYKTQQEMKCGCLICGRSGPGTVVANAAYTTSEEALIGPTLYKGLIDNGAKDGDWVTITIKAE
jgi:hypothetical protein